MPNQIAPPGTEVPPPSYPEQTPILPADATIQNTSYFPSPESKSTGLHRSILKEMDEKMASDTATTKAPDTPTDTHHNNQLSHESTASHMLKQTVPHPFASINTYPKPSIPSKTPTPAVPVEIAESAPDIKQKKAPKTPSKKRPTASTTQSTAKDLGIKRAVSELFRRSHSHAAHPQTLQPMNSMIEVDAQVMASPKGSDSMSSKERRWLPVRKMPASGSRDTTRSNTPPSPASPAKDSPLAQIQIQEPMEAAFFASGRTKNRSSTGFSLRQAFAKHKIALAHSQEQEAPKIAPLRHRATSVDLDSTPVEKNESGAQLPPRQIWGIPADTGTGLKARRMSLSLPDDLLVDVAELYKEYADHTKVAGLRGKSIGKGATAHVRLVNRKGFPNELYAVKEFRGKSRTEKEEDYEKKVKSEFSIAKSIHHPNVVETFRLCIHNGRWNHVMEFCDQGDLFSLVSQKYLAIEDHLLDRVCLFKQLVQGLNYLHNHGIAHRDVKLENLLVTKDSKLKITDFGVSEVFAGIHPGLRSAGGQCGKDMGQVRLCAPGMCGSPPYVAPEVIAKQGEYDPRPLDVWGAAIVMLCMCANGVLWNEARAGSSPLYDDLIRGWAKWNTKHEQSESNITDTDYPFVKFFDEHISPPALRRILLTMLNPDPSKRSSMATVAKNRWLKNVECCQLDSYDEPPTTIDAGRPKTSHKSIMKVVHHNHLPPHKHLGHGLVRLPGSTEI